MARTRQRVPQQDIHDHDHDHAPQAPQVGNQEMIERMRQQQRAPQAPQRGPAQAPRQTPQQQFQQQYTDRRNEALSEDRRNMPRWRQLTPEQIAALPQYADGQAPTAGQRGYTTSINGATYQYDVVPEDPQRATTNGDLMGPQASQFMSRAFVTDRPRQNPNNPQERQFQDVMSLNQDGTTSTLRQNEHGMVELPTSGFGFSTYNRNDVRLTNGQPQQDQWGTPQMIAAMMNIGHDYRMMNPNQNIEYGDIATNDNQSPLLDTGRTARHATHGAGTQTDLRYPDTAFQRNTLVRTSENWGMNNFYYNPDWQNSTFFSDSSRATPEGHHRDHLHMGIGRGGR